MSITDEFRKYVQCWRETPQLLEDLDAGDIDGILADLERFADRIDAEHEREVRQAHADGLNEQVDFHDNFVPSNYTLLPVDADGVPIHLGDRMGHDGARVERIVLKADGEHSVYLAKLPNVLHEYFCCEIAHHAPTVEELLVEFGTKWHTTLGVDAEHELIAEYATKLRLAGEGES